MTDRQTIGELRDRMEAMPPQAAALILLQMAADCASRLPVRARQTFCDTFGRDLWRMVAERMSGRAA